jgi:arabinan endo-1,5-alpha-L-arabinosidase
MKTSDIQIRDPFIVSHLEDNNYYMFGTTDKNCWRGPGQGFDCYKSENLVDWDGPMAAFRPPASFWGKENFWAPEVHFLNGKYYMFATFIAERRYRATHILVSDKISGPYGPLTKDPITPPDWQCLDGTLHVDDNGRSWIIFCHEWVQIHNGAIFALLLTSDLKQPAGRPHFLFNASEAAWVNPHTDWQKDERQRGFPTYVTDGPYLYRHGNGELLMLWSSFGSKGYAMGMARSETGQVTGPWRQDPEPLWAEDGGHGMIFKTFDGKLMLTFHSPNKTPLERAVFVELEETAVSLKLKSPKNS